MSEENAASGTEDPALHIIDEIQSYFPILHYIGLLIEIIFFFVMIRNWNMKETFLKSAFFYFLTLKTINHFIYMLYVITNTYWANLVIYIYHEIETLFFIFSLEVDALCQFIISINRFTALMVPLRHDSVSLIILFESE